MKLGAIVKSTYQRESCYNAYELQNFLVQEDAMSVFVRFAMVIQKYCALDREYRRDVVSLFMFNPDAKLLDLGCGNGDFTMKVAQKICTSHIYGVDVVAESVSQARAIGINCITADLNDRFPFEDASFDVICANQVLEHLSDTDGFIKEIRRLLKPDGYAVISTPNLASWSCIAFLLLDWQPYGVEVSDDFFWAGRPHTQAEEKMGGTMPQHRRIFVLRALKELLQYHNFVLDKYIGSGLRPLPAPLARIFIKSMTRRADIITVRILKTSIRKET
jgi:2-polyprenyl-3-methyl-5-hydroxy-6-metoxy-1,4-benzoquinol methylase